MSATLLEPVGAWRGPRHARHDVAGEPPRVGPVDGLDADAVIALLPGLAAWHHRTAGYDKARLLAAGTILGWLSTFAGMGWQQRWLASGADDDLGWVDELASGLPGVSRHRRHTVMGGLGGLLLCRVVLPSYGFLTAYRAKTLFYQLRQAVRPEMFAQLEQAGIASGMRPVQVIDGLKAVAKMVLHTGRDPDQLTAQDVLRYRSAGMLDAVNRFHKSQSPNGTFESWAMLRAVGILADQPPLIDVLRHGQRSTVELVDSYGVQCRPVRDLLVRYLDERRPALDFGTFRVLVAVLVGRFWRDIEAHHPGIDSLRLSAEVADAWKQRLSRVRTRGGDERPRSDYIEQLLNVRAFYLDIAQWALEDPSWAPWAVPCPIRRSETVGIYRKRQKVVARMHQRVRERLPQLGVLIDAADTHRREQADLLARATATPVGEDFQHAGISYRRVARRSSPAYNGAEPVPAVLVQDTTAGRQVNLTRAEDEAFWAWAVIETLRHTGVRVEELLEITQLALVSYRLADTDELVPLLQIVPSKSDEERLLLVSPELASVLATIIARLRAANGGAIPLVARYDPYERTTGPALPHLFQHQRGWRHEVRTSSTVRNLLKGAFIRAGLYDAAGGPLDFTPHDFRRLFATDAVTGGLPVHITARLLGHRNLDTVQSYLAVFQDDLIRSYRAFLDQRRAVRPPAEYREPTDEEWREFQQHFALRKVELGTCGRPYGSPCKHEHACVRCPMLRVDPKQRARLVEIIRNLGERIADAQLNGWLGEVQGLQVSLHAAQAKLASLHRAANTIDTSTVHLGLPVLRTST